MIAIVCAAAIVWVRMLIVLLSSSEKTVPIDPPPLPLPTMPDIPECERPDVLCLPEKPFADPPPDPSAPVPAPFRYVRIESTDAYQYHGVANRYGGEHPGFPSLMWSGSSGRVVAGPYPVVAIDALDCYDEGGRNLRTPDMTLDASPAISPAQFELRVNGFVPGVYAETVVVGARQKFASTFSGVKPVVIPDSDTEPGFIELDLLRDTPVRRIIVKPAPLGGGRTLDLIGCKLILRSDAGAVVHETTFPGRHSRTNFAAVDPTSSGGGWMFRAPQLDMRYDFRLRPGPEHAFNSRLCVSTDFWGVAACRENILDSRSAQRVDKRRAFSDVFVNCADPSTHENLHCLVPDPSRVRKLAQARAAADAADAASRAEQEAAEREAEREIAERERPVPPTPFRFIRIGSRQDEPHSKDMLLHRFEVFDRPTHRRGPLSKTAAAAGMSATLMPPRNLQWGSRSDASNLIRDDFPGDEALCSTTSGLDKADACKLEGDVRDMHAVVGDSYHVQDPDDVDPATGRMRWKRVPGYIEIDMGSDRDVCAIVFWSIVLAGEIGLRTNTVSSASLTLRTSDGRVVFEGILPADPPQAPTSSGTVVRTHVRIRAAKLRPEYSFLPPPVAEPHGGEEPYGPRDGLFESLGLHGGDLE